MRKGLVLLAALCALITVSATASAQKPRVAVATGALEGVAADGVESFRGIRYAAPPVGPLRWRPTQPAAAWKGVRDASQFGPDCMQGQYPLFPSPVIPYSEDCLLINVWRPADVGKKLPVMVWIHGGGFVNGGSSDRTNGGAQFAEQGVILVSFNYRLGRFGFFGFPALTAEDPNGLLGNYAYMDQIAALKWVKANIAAFGGDPDNITIFGESAGGGSVHVMLTSPLAAGLFNRAIIESGGGRGHLLGKRLVTGDLPNMPSLETVGVSFAKANGINGTDAAALAALRALPAEKIAGGLQMFTMGQQAQIYGGPAVDGKIVVLSPEDAYKSGKFAQVPVMIGANNADIGIGGARSLDAALAVFGPGNKDKALAAYDPDHRGDTHEILWDIAMDRTMVEPARFTAQEFSKHGLPAYEFRFSYVAPADAAAFDRNPAAKYMVKGAQHASEVKYVFGAVATMTKSATDADLAMAKTMNAYWINFGKTGNPNGPGLPEWPAYTVQNDTLMHFTQEGAKAMPDPWRARMDLTAARTD